MIFYKGLVMDFSICGYFLMFFCIVMALSPFVAKKVVVYILKYSSLLFFTIFWLIILADLEIFRSWGYHLDATVLSYIKTPKAAMASLTTFQLLFMLIVWVVLTTFSFWIYRRWIEKPFDFVEDKRHWVQMPVFLIIGVLMIIPIRGGLGLAPLNNSFVFFHKTNMFANQAAINPAWNFMYEVTHRNRINNIYNFLPQEEAKSIVDSLYLNKTIYPHFVKANPNIIFLLLESFSADGIEVLGGEKGVTPSINNLAKEGILFSNIYATGNRSDRGIAAAIGGLPSHPAMAIIRYPNRSSEFPSVPLKLEKQGYSTRFYYAGDINFGGFRSYVTMNFQKIITEKDFSGEALKHTFKWGIHDEYMLERLYEDASKAASPYFYMGFTMSSHEPFEVPTKTVITGNTEDRRVLNAMNYTDRAVGRLVDSLKNNGMWENTLLVLIADHGIRKIKNREVYEPAAFHIPMIFSGGALLKKDTVITTLGSQTDIVATLLAQLNVDNSDFKYSKNLLAKDVHQFAYYAYNNTIGFISLAGTTVYNLKTSTYLLGDSITTNLRPMKAYLQVLDESYK
jgi:phosphoglycerol transferase MdoB-like AlkP superfamily enzyme